MKKPTAPSRSKSLPALLLLISLNACSPQLPITGAPPPQSDTFTRGTETFCRIHNEKLITKPGYCTSPGTMISWGEFVFDLAAKYPNARHASTSLTKSDFCNTPTTLEFCPTCQKGWDATD